MIRAFSLLIFFSTLLTELLLSAAVTVIVDPGHGGVDDGATRANIREADVTLKISKAIQEVFSKDPRFKVYATRSAGEGPSLAQRAQIAKQRQGHLFLSIHANSSIDPRARGTEIYFQNQLPPDEESLFLASHENHAGVDGEDNPSSGWPLNPLPNSEKYSADVVSILKDLQRNQRVRLSGELGRHLIESWQPLSAQSSSRIRQGPFFVITEVNMPSVLIEIGFISHPDEFKKIQDPEYHVKMAKQIYQGLLTYAEKHLAHLL